MANIGQELGPEIQSPDISSSGIPLGLELEQELMHPSEPWWVPKHQGCKRRRDQLCWEDEEEEEEEEEEAEEEEEEDRDNDDDNNSLPGLFDILSRGLFSEGQREEEDGSCRRPKKRRRLQHRDVLPEYHIAFTRMLTDPVVKRFLAWDQHLEVSDKYQLAKVVAYFRRFGLFGWQLRSIHFFLALYLANNMEVDHHEARETIFSLHYGTSRLQLPQFHRQRQMLLSSMRWWTMVSWDEIKEIQAYDPDLWVWSRNRTNQI